MRFSAWKYIPAVIALVTVVGTVTVLPGTVRAETPPTQQWAARYNGAGNSDEAYDIAVDGSGNSYVTGRSFNGSNYDYATVKYNAAGVQQWAARYNGTANSTDWARAIAVDASGNSYVTGQSYDGSNFYYATVKYNVAGVQQWVARYPETASANNIAYAIAVDASGNSYVTGRGSNISSYDYATVKYNAAGVQQWAMLYNGTGNGYDEAKAIVVDTGGNSYVTGYSFNGSMTDYATVKYNAEGIEQWVSRYTGTGNYDDYAIAIALDAGGNSYVTGQSYNGSNDDYATVKYNAAGVQQWAARYNGTGNGHDQAAAIAVDAGGNSCVTGRSWNGSSYDYATVKYNTAGGQQWATPYNGTGNGNDQAVAIAMDTGGNYYVTGFSSNGSKADYATVKYDTAGAEMWAMRYSGMGANNVATAIAVDAGGNAYVTGYSENGSNMEYATIKYARNPVISAISPATGNRGQCPVTVIIAGTNLTGATAVSFGTGINVSGFTVNSATQITATVCIDASAAPGAYNITVTTLGGTYMLTGGFTVALNTLIGTGSHSSTLSAAAPVSTAPPVSLPSILIQSANLSATTVTPGTPITVTADIANKSAVNGNKKVTLYVNGQVETTQGVTVNSGGSTKLTFNVSRSEPGDYIVYVDGVPAGSFKVELFRESDGILIFSAVLVALAFLIGIAMLWRRQRAV